MVSDSPPAAAPALDSIERYCSESFVRHAEYFDSLDSTNNRAVELARQPDLPSPALVVARRQLAGRGRGNNTWWADDGAITFSLVLETSLQGITPRDWPKLSLASAVAACDAIGAELSSNPHSAFRIPRSPSNGPTMCFLMATKSAAS
jgi:Biotin/lipoate A/B protein ligase family